METAQVQAVKKAVKTRSRSLGLSRNSPIAMPAVSEVAPDLNGDKQTESEEPPVLPIETNAISEDDGQKQSKPVQGRKRKASELKSDDSTPEELPDLPPPIITEEPPILKPIPKEDALSSDSSSDISKTKSIDSPDLNKTPLGKGKRARIPNKKYDDSVVSPYSKLSNITNIEHLDASVDELSLLKSDMENGILPNVNSSEVTSTADVQISSESILTDENTNRDETSPQIASSTLSSPATTTRLSQKISLTFGGSPASSASKKAKLSIDLNDPAFSKPFEFGWKRELVYRSTIDGNLRRNGDIYYYTPSGKKVRSMREVSENLKSKELTVDNFTFFKGPLGIDDPDKEIIRDAKTKLPTGATPVSIKKAPKLPKAPRSPKEKTSSPRLLSPKGGTANSKASKTPSLGGFKVKLPGRASQGGAGKSKASKKNKSNIVESDEVVSGMLPPNYTSPTKKTPARNAKLSKMNPKAKKQIIKPPLVVAVSDKNEEGQFMDNYLQNLAFGYTTLLYVFQHLKVQDLLRAGCVCSMWRDLARHHSLWKTVRMKNSQIHDFEGLADALEQYGTINLDLRKMLVPSSTNTLGGDEKIWPSFSSAIARATSLRRIELCRCPAKVIESLAESNPELEVINAVTIKCETMSLSPLITLKNLQELRLKSTAGFALTSDLSALKELVNLKVLSLTSIKDLHKLNIEVIAELQNLESLDFGECTDFPYTFGVNILSKLTKLEKLRLEKGQGTCYTFEILEAVKQIPTLEQLELVNFDIKFGFDKALGACMNIKKLLIIPTYISQSATTNHMVLGGVLRLQTTLTHFVWGVTLELLRVTELFVDQCEESEKKDKKDKKDKKPTGSGDSIPVLKPVPLLQDGSPNEIPPAQDPPQVEILPLPTLQKLLLQSLPSTRVKILKIPFHATWRQSIIDTVN